MKIATFQYDSLPSTNDMAFDLLRQGYSPPFIVLAVRQTRGRGRGTHSWFSPEGGLWFSVALGGISFQCLPGLSLWTAYVTAARLRALTFLPIQIKLPNDLILHNKKLGGILIEIKNRTAVAGIGLNTNISSFPPSLQEKATSIFQVLGQKIEHTEVYPWIAEHLWNYTQSSSPPPSGWIPQVNAWLYGRGHLVAVTIRDQRIQGILQEVTLDFQMILNTPSGERVESLAFLKDFEIVNEG